MASGIDATRSNAGDHVRQAIRPRLLEERIAGPPGHLGRGTELGEQRLDGHQLGRR